MKNIYDLLPETISDEGAYHLVNFLMNLTLEVEVHYFSQIRRYIDDNALGAEGSDFLQNEQNNEPNEFDDELPF